MPVDFEVDFATLSGKADNDIIVLVQVVSHLKNTRAAVTTLLVLLVLITELEISGPFAICNQQDRYLSSEGRSKEATRLKFIRRKDTGGWHCSVEQYQKE